MIDTPQEAMIGDKAARELLEVEKLKAVNAELLEALLLIDPTGEFEDWHDSNNNEIGFKIKRIIAKALGELNELE